MNYQWGKDIKKNRTPTKDVRFLIPSICRKLIFLIYPK